MKYAHCILAFVLVLFASAMCMAQDQVKLNPEQTRIIEKGDENGEWYETTEVMGSDGKYHEVGRKNLNTQAESKTAPKPDIASQKPETKIEQVEPTISTTVEPSVTSNNTVEPTEDVPAATPVVSTPVIIAGETSTPKQTKPSKNVEPVTNRTVSPVAQPDRSNKILSEIRELSGSISAIGQEINEAVIRNSKQAEIISRQIAIENNQAEIRNAQDQILQQLDKRKQTTYRPNPFYLATSFIYGLLLGICLALLTVLYMLGELGSLFKRKKKDEKKEDDDDDDEEDIGEPDLEALEWEEMKKDLQVAGPPGEFDHYYEVANPDDYPEVDPEKVETAATAQEVNDDSTAVTLTDATGTTDYNKKLFELRAHEPALQMVLLIVLGGSVEAAKQLYGCLISILVRNVPPVELYGLKKIFVGFPLGSHASEDGTEVYFSEGTTSAEMAIGLEQARKERLKFAEQNKPQKAQDHMRPSDIGNPGL